MSPCLSVRSELLGIDLRRVFGDEGFELSVGPFRGRLDDGAGGFGRSDFEGLAVGEGVVAV